MITKVHKRRNGKDAKSQDFGDTVSYCAGKADAVELVNLAGQWTDAVWQMNAVAAGNTRVTRPVYHLTCSWAPLERPTNAQAFAAARQLLSDLGLEDHQAVFAVHRDKDHVHVHIVLNRVHPLTGKAFQTQHDYLRLERACRGIEQAQGWSADRGGFDTRVVDGDVKLVPRSPEDWEAFRQTRARRRAGRLSIFDRLSDGILEQIRTAIAQAPQWADLHTALGRLGWHYKRHGSGARLWLRGTREFFKPSLLGPGFGFHALVRRLGTYIPAPSLPKLPANDRQDCAIAGEPAAADRARTQSLRFRRAILARFYVAITSDAAIVDRLESVELGENATRVLLQDGTQIIDTGPRIGGTGGADPNVTARLMVALAMAKGWTMSKPEGSLALLLALNRTIDRMRPRGAAQHALAAWERGEKEHEAVRMADAKRRQDWHAEQSQLLDRQAARRDEIFAAVGRRRDPVSRMLRAMVERFHLDERAALRARYPRSEAPHPQRPPDFVAVTAPVRPQQTALPADHTGCRQHWMHGARLGADHPWAQARRISQATLDRFAGRLRPGPAGSVLMAHARGDGSIVGFEYFREEDEEARPRSHMARGGVRSALVLGDATRAGRAVVCASGREAMALAEIEARNDTIYISTAGWTAATRKRLEPLLRGKHVVASFTTGDGARDRNLHANLAGLAPDAARLVPPGGTATWAEHLAERAEREALPAPCPHPQLAPPPAGGATAAAERRAAAARERGRVDPAEPHVAAMVVIAPDHDTYRDFVAWEWPLGCEPPQLLPLITSFAGPRDLAQRAVFSLEQREVAEVIIVFPPGVAVAAELPSHPALRLVASPGPGETFIDVPTSELPHEEEDFSPEFP